MKVEGDRWKEEEGDKGEGGRDEHCGIYIFSVWERESKIVPVMCTLTLHLYSLLGGGEHPPCVVTLWGCSLCAAQWSGIKHRPLLPSAHPEPVPEATRTRAKPRDSPAF